MAIFPEKPPVRPFTFGPPLLVLKKNPLNISGMVCVGWMSFLPTNHQCQSTGGDKKCFNMALFFFIHNWTPNERGNSSFRTLLQYQQQITKALNHKNIKHN